MHMHEYGWVLSHGLNENMKTGGQILGYDTYTLAVS